MRLKINDVIINIDIHEDIIVLKPITDIKILQDYQFTMSKNKSAEYLISKLNEISNNVKRYSI